MPGAEDDAAGRHERLHEEVAFEPRLFVDEPCARGLAAFDAALDPVARDAGEEHRAARAGGLGGPRRGRVDALDQHVDGAAADEAALVRDVVRAPLVEGFESLSPGTDDYVVVVTRGAGLDLACCRAALATEARYVGMLGSRKKAATVKEALASGGNAPGRLHAPIGLDLGALSAGEIALSIVAQMIKVRRTGRGDR